MKLPAPFARLLRAFTGVAERDAPAASVAGPAAVQCEDADSYMSLGVFSPSDAERLLNTFEAVGIRFQIEMDEAAMTARRGGTIVDRETRIFVHRDDSESAQVVIEDVQPIVLRN